MQRITQDTIMLGTIMLGTITRKLVIPTVPQSRVPLRALMAATMSTASVKSIG